MKKIPKECSKTEVAAEPSLEKEVASVPSLENEISAAPSLENEVASVPSLENEISAGYITSKPREYKGYRDADRCVQSDVLRTTMKHVHSGERVLE